MTLARTTLSLRTDTLPGQIHYPGKGKFSFWAIRHLRTETIPGQVFPGSFRPGSNSTFEDHNYTMESPPLLTRLRQPDFLPRSPSSVESQPVRTPEDRLPPPRMETRAPLIRSATFGPLGQDTNYVLSQIKNQIDAEIYQEEKMMQHLHGITNALHELTKPRLRSLEQDIPYLTHTLKHCVQVLEQMQPPQFT